jgi:hypothetical protein
MRISLKVIGLLWLGLFLIIGGLLFNAYSKLKPEAFIALITEQVQRNYPGAKLNVGKVSYGFSLDFKLNLQDIHLRRADKLLGSIGEVELIVPWWLLLTNKGNAQINLSKLDIFIDHGDSQPVREKSEDSEPAKPMGSMIQVSLPKYLADAHFTLRAKEVSVRDIHNARRYFMVSKLLVREFQYGKNSAFELNIPIMIKHGGTQYQSDLWLFGDVTPETSLWKFNHRGEFRTKETNDKFQIEDLIINGTSSFNPADLSIISDLNLLVEKDVIGKGRLNATQEELSIDLQLTKLPLNYFGFVYEEIQNPYLKKLVGEASGSIKFNRSFDSSFASVVGKLIFNGELQVSDSYIIPGTWKIGFQDTKWEISFMSPKGEASFFRRSVMDMNKGIVTQYSDELGFSNLELPKVMAPVTPFATFLTEVPKSYYISSISYNKCLDGDKTVSGNFRYGSTPDQKFYQGDLKETSSSMKIAYSDKASQKAIDLNFLKFKYTPYYQFLIPFFSANDGLINGKVEGRWSTDWDSGQWLVQINGSHLDAPQGKIPDFINKTSSFFELDAKASKVQSLNLSAKNNLLLLNSLMLEFQESVNMTGSLSSTQKSVLTLTYPKNKKFKPLKKEVLEPYWMQKEEI